MMNVLNSVKIKTKLILIYMLCVLLSVGILAGFYIFSIVSDTRSNISSVLEQQTAYMASTLADQISSAYLITENIELNNDIKSFFAEEKQDYESYREVSDSLRGLLAIQAKCISGISFYCTAKTYSTLGMISYIESAEDLCQFDWGESFLRSGKEIAFIPSVSFNGGQVLSIVRYSFIGEDYVCVLKLDLNVAIVQSLLSARNFDSEVQITLYQNGQSLFSNGTVDAEDTVVIDAPLGKNALVNGLYIRMTADAYELYAAVRSRTLISAAGAAAVAIGACGIILLVSNSIILRLKILRDHLTDTTNGKYCRIDSAAGDDEIGESIRAYNVMVDTIRQLFDDIYKAGEKEAKLRAEISAARYIALKAQIDPHYFYNVLNTIQAKSFTKGETETANVILTVARIFRDIISWKDDLIPIENELERIERHMVIQKYRFGEKFSYQINCAEPLLFYLIPKMTILTLVENACRHGLENVGGVGEVRVDIYEENENIHIRVFDSGKPLTGPDLDRIRGIMTNECAAEDSKGLNNIYSRLKMYFGEHVEIDIFPLAGEGNIFAVRIAVSALQKRRMLNENSDRG